MTFQNGVNSALITTILDKIAVKKGSTKEKIHLDIHLKYGGPWEAIFDRRNSSFRFTRSLTDKANGKELWKACGQKDFQTNNGEMVCHYTAI